MILKTILKGHNGTKKYFSSILDQGQITSEFQDKDRLHQELEIGLMEDRPNNNLGGLDLSKIGNGLNCISRTTKLNPSSKIQC